MRSSADNWVRRRWWVAAATLVAAAAAAVFVGGLTQWMACDVPSSRACENKGEADRQLIVAVGVLTASLVTTGAVALRRYWVAGAVAAVTAVLLAVWLVLIVSL